jgi:hypothetical protein
VKPLGETPYDDDVSDLARVKCVSLDRARDMFIYIALQMGEPGPLICFLLRGYVPGLAIRQHIAMMMLDDEATQQDDFPKEVLRKVLCRFEIKARSGKRGPKRGNFRISVRNYKYRKQVQELIAKLGRGSYLAAITKVAEETGLSEQSIRHAYDQGTRSSK